MAPVESASDGIPRDLAAAWLAVHFHGLHATVPSWAQAQPASIASEHRPLALSDAVDVLLNYRHSPQRALASAFVAWAHHRAQDLVNARTALPGDSVASSNQGYAQVANDYEQLSDALLRLHADVPDFPGIFQTAEEAYLYSLGAISGLAQCVTGFSWSSVYDVGLESTEVSVTVDVARPVTDFEHLIDPQNWTVVAQDTFLGAYRTSDTSSPDDPSTDPTRRLAPPSLAPPWAELFFERARWAINGLAFSEFRNVLKIDYQPGVLMKYELHENLTQDVLGFHEQGGLDIDSGTVTLTAETNGVGTTTMTAVKRIRFCAPIQLKSYLNWLNLPLLTMWMLQAIVGGACQPAPRL